MPSEDRYFDLHRRQKGIMLTSPCQGPPTSALRYLAFMVTSIFLVEAGVMFILERLPPLSTTTEALVDSLLLTLLLCPAYYCFLFRPFKAYIDQNQYCLGQVRHYSRQMISATESERKRLARDLHDEFGQILSALQFDIEILKTTCQPETPECQRLAGHIGQLGSRVRYICNNLRPAALDKLGLVPALHWHTEEFAHYNPQIEVDFQARGGSVRLPGEAEIALFRICQEALNNVAKFSRAKRVEILLEHDESRISLAVSDDGTGFDLAAARPERGEHGTGLKGMEERVQALGGSLSVCSAIDEGTSIRLELPLLGEAAHG